MVPPLPRNWKAFVSLHTDLTVEVNIPSHEGKKCWRLETETETESEREGCGCAMVSDICMGGR